VYPRAREEFIVRSTVGEDINEATEWVPAAGHDAFTAIVESAVRRFRPITLTAAAAVLALIPLAREVFWAPMAIAMMGGLVAATILTLTFLPALYALAFRISLPSHPDAQSIDESPLAPRPMQALQAAKYHARRRVIKVARTHLKIV
jgi:uncharacterized membrane protein YdfJ with MMPL/SSD domain